jgi:hypothetical protein
MRPWADPNHKGNKLRPCVRCLGCGTLGCVTYWGPWCFSCNVERMDRLCKAFTKLERGEL